MSGAAIGMGIADLIFEYVTNRKKLKNELLDGRKDVVFFADGTSKEQYFIHERRND
ncbi:MAG TPA: hypothetical protein VLE02_05175 [Nitrosarchaeum sp.]|nr:hypothetical protein [Nitrosarchaeum sp.]